MRSCTQQQYSWLNGYIEYSPYRESLQRNYPHPYSYLYPRPSPVSPVATPPRRRVCPSWWAHRPWYTGPDRLCRPTRGQCLSVVRHILCLRISSVMTGWGVGRDPVCCTHSYWLMVRGRGRLMGICRCVQWQYADDQYMHIQHTIHIYRHNRHNTYMI